jgi:hypothetical protein
LMNTPLPLSLPKRRSTHLSPASAITIPSPVQSSWGTTYSIQFGSRTPRGWPWITTCAVPGVEHAPKPSFGMVSL